MRAWVGWGVALLASVAGAQEPAATPPPAPDVAGNPAMAKEAEPAGHCEGGSCEEGKTAGCCEGGGTSCCTGTGGCCEPMYAWFAGDHAGLEESRLGPAESTTRLPPNWTGDIEPRPRDPWVQNEMDWHRSFLQPLVLPSVFPEVSARLASVAGWHRATGSVDLDQQALLSLYAFDLYFPVFTLRDAANVSAGSFRFDVKLPWHKGHHAMTLFLGADVPVEGALIDHGGAHTIFGYAFGSRLFQAQARAGFGVDRMIANWGGDLRSSFLWDAAAAVRPWNRLQLIVQADGRKVAGANLADVRVWPALRYFPVKDNGLSLGAGAMFWWENTASNWSLHRPGGVFDVSWAFL